MKKLQFIIASFLFITGAFMLIIFLLSDLALADILFYKEGVMKEPIRFEGMAIFNYEGGIMSFFSATLSIIIGGIMARRIHHKDKNILKDILKLRSRRLTFILGMFFPFFVCHIGAYSCGLPPSGIKKDAQEEGYDWAAYVFVMLYNFIAFFVLYIIALFPQVTLMETPTERTVLIPIGIMLFGNLFLTLIYGVAFHDSIAESTKWLDEKKSALA